MFSSLRLLHNPPSIITMNAAALEATLSDISRRLASLEARSPVPRGQGWQTIAGRAKDDDLMEEAMKLGAEWRARANALPPESPPAP